MAESIQSVHVEYTASTKQTREEMELGAKKAEEYGRRVGQSVKAAKTSGPAMAAGVKPATKAWGQLGQQVAGAPATIAVASNAMVAFGAKGAGAIGAVGGGLASLLASGFTPLGVAIGVATIAMAAFGASADKVDPQIKSAGDRVKSLQERVSKLKDELIATEAVGFGKRQEFIDAQTLRAAESKLENLTSRLEHFRRAAADLPEAGFIAGFGSEGKLRARYDEEIKRLAPLARAQRLRVQLLRDELAAKRDLADFAKGIDPRRRDLSTAILEMEGAGKLSEARAEAAKKTLDAFVTIGEIEDRVMASVADLLRGDIPPLDPQVAFELSELGREAAETEQAHRDLYETMERGPDAAEIARQAARIKLGLKPGDGVTFADIWGLPPESEAPEAPASFGQGFAEQIARDLKTIDEIGAAVAISLTDNLGDAMAEFALGAMTGKEAMRSFASSVVSDLARIASQDLALSLFSSFGGGGEDSGKGGLIGGAVKGLIGFERGGAFRVGGSGGADSQLVAFKASPDETVTVETPGQRGGGRRAIINLHNYGVDVTPTSTVGPSGDEIIDIVARRVAQDFATGGPVSRSAEQHYALRRRGRTQ